MPLSFHSKAAESSAYRADIDGLRAIAVLSVVFFHADFAGFSGGFVGVDVFFVISGYLITRIIEADIDNGRFTFRGFYERRIRRIFPALFTVALFCTLAAAVLFPTARFIDFAHSLRALGGFASNIYFAATAHAAGYFDTTDSPQLLLHTWTLSLEEQFYLLFPVLLLLLNRFARPGKRWLVLGLLLLSFDWSVLTLQHAPVAAFYLLPSRAWELLLGAMLALRSLPPLRNAVARNLAALLGLAGIVYAVYTFTSTTQFPGYNALYPCLGALLVLYAGEAGPSFVQAVLSFRPLVFIGAISYSLYLWHWPVFVLARYWFAEYAVRPEQFILPILLSVLLAFLSFEFIETPLRKRHGSAPTALKVIGIGLPATAAMALLGFAIIASHGLPHRMNAGKLRLIDTNYARKTEFPVLSTCANFRIKMTRYEDADFCEFGHQQHNILFWGDSHMAQLDPLLKDMLNANQLNGHGMVYAIAAGCPPSAQLNLTWAGYYCDTFNRYAMERAAKPDIDTVFLAFSPWWTTSDGKVCVAQASRCIQPLTHDQAWQRVVDETAQHVRDLRRQNKRVIICLPFPIYDKLIPDFVIRHQLFIRLARRMDYPYQLLSARLNDQLKAAVTAAGAEIFDPRTQLCPNGQCIYAVDGLSLYSDQSHLATSQVGLLHDGLMQAIYPPPTDHSSAP